MFDSFIFCSLRSLFNSMYLGTLTRWSTAGPCSRQSSDIYTPSCIGVPSYFLWRLATEKKTTEFETVQADASLCDASVLLLS